MISLRTTECFDATYRILDRSPGLRGLPPWPGDDSHGWLHGSGTLGVARSGVGSAGGRAGRTGFGGFPLRLDSRAQQDRPWERGGDRRPAKDAAASRVADYHASRCYRQFFFVAEFGSLLCIENMDKRKPIGRSAGELRSIFDQLPDASLCFDIGHARQVDTTMTESYLILKEFGAKLRQVHMSQHQQQAQSALVRVDFRISGSGALDSVGRPDHLGDSCR